jgi:hypothetical protein
VRVWLLTLLAVFGLGTSVWGGVNLWSLREAYRGADLAVSETPESFSVWLFEDLGASEADAGLSSSRISNRLLRMPLDKRRRAANAMMTMAFWQPFGRLPGGLRGAQRRARDGILLALRAAPTSGDLYLTAAWLESMTDGFGKRGQDLLQASHVFAPRELAVVRGRLILGGRVWPLLSPEQRKALQADLATFRRVDAVGAAAFEARLVEEGLRLE